jgi:hypothetical protein
LDYVVALKCHHEGSYKRKTNRGVSQERKQGDTDLNYCRLAARETEEAPQRP